MHSNPGLVLPDPGILCTLTATLWSVTTTPTSTELRVIGMSDEQTECDRCGRPELRGTVIIADADGNETGRYGTSCATRMLNNGVKVTQDYARSVEMARRNAVVWDLKDARRYHQAGDQARALAFVASARRRGLIRADEITLADKIENEEN